VNPTWESDDDLHALPWPNVPFTFVVHKGGPGFAAVLTAGPAIENDTLSIWINEQLRGYGHEVIVANVRELHAKSKPHYRWPR
jgi:hypothetical protein